MIRLALLLAAGLAVAACGKTGPLERPGPLWGAAEKAKYEAERRTASAQANQPAKPGSTQEAMDPASSPRTVQQNQLRGVADPFAAPTGRGTPNSGPQ